MDAKDLHLAAWDLRTELFNLVNKIKDLQARADDEDERMDMDQVSCALARIHDTLPPVFTVASTEN